ncbi:MAG: DUF1062 domain-containing protein [bacterium]|nr:DUF1062 domain-containing protein [bacterium]
MSYLQTISYKIIPQESYRVIHNCPGCGCKAHFINTNTFRVNANGNRIDVWLIYQCETCKHTLNLTIYERQNPASIPDKEYQQFLQNDEQLAKAYGMDKSLFSKNKKRIEERQVSYQLVMEKEHQNVVRGGEQMDNHYIEIHNEFGLKLRMDKVIASLLHMTRSQEKKAEQEGLISVIKSDSKNKVILLMKV